MNIEYRLVLERTLGSAELRPNFLPMLSQFGFPPKNVRTKFCSTIFCRFLPQMGQKLDSFLMEINNLFHPSLRLNNHTCEM